MRLSWLICIVAICISICIPMVTSQCPNCNSGTWDTSRSPSPQFNDPEDIYVTISVAETLNLQQEGSRIKGTSDRGFSLDGNLSGPYEGQMPAAGLQETVQKHCKWVGNLSVPSGEGKRNYGKFTFGITADCNYFQGNFEVNGSQGWWKGQRSGSTETAPASYELAISAPDKVHHPLSMDIALTEDGKPIKNAKVQVHAYDIGDNSKALADYALAPSCTNCDWSSLGNKKVAILCKPQPLLDLPCDVPFNLTTDNSGIAKLELFLGLGEKDAKIPKRDAPLTIPLLVEYWKTDQNGKDLKAAEKKVEVKLDSIASVGFIEYKSPQKQDPNSEPVQSSGLLSGWNDDIGTQVGDIKIFKSDRVTLQPADGSAKRTLNSNDYVSPGDEITINTGGMLPEFEEGRLFRGKAGEIAVTLNFFDGFVGKVIVPGTNLGTHTVEIGDSPQGSGWSINFVNLATAAGAKYVVKNLFPATAPIANAHSVFGVLNFLSTNKPVYVQAKSSIVTDFDEAGRMLVTTREGEAVVSTGPNSDEILAVPAGKTAVVPKNESPFLIDTDSETARQADELLAGLEDPLASSTVFQPSPSSGGATAGGADFGPGNTATGNATAGPAASSGAPGSISGPSVSAPGASGGVVAPTDNNQIGDSADTGLEQSITQSINPAGSSNFYRFHVASPGLLKLRLENAPAEMKPEMSLYDKNFAYVVSKSAANLGDSLTLEKDLSGPAWYYIEVKDGNGKAHSEPYSLKITFEAASDVQEPNPNFLRAVEVQAGEGIEGYICPVNDEDFYKIYADTSGILKLKLDTVPADMKSELTLYDKGFGYMTSSAAANPGDSMSLEKDLQGPGWFFIKVRDADGKAHSEPYSLAVSLKSAPDQSEPNPNFFRATETATGQGVSAYICPVNDEDFYKFYVNGQQIVSFRLDSVPAEMKGELTLYDKGFGYVTSSTAANPGDKVKLEKDVKGPGWFFVKVRDANGKAYSEPYSMTIQ